MLFHGRGSFREAASAAVGLRPNRSISACQLTTSKRFVVIFSITRNWTLSTTAFQRKINRKSRKKAEKKGRQRGSAFPLGGTDAINRNGPSRENAVQKRPQAFLNCQYKNFISAKYAQSNAEGILNRSPHREQVNKKPVRKNSHWLVCDWLTGASGCAGHWCGT